MKTKIRRGGVLLFAALLLMTKVSAFADAVAPDPMPGDYRNIMPYVILIAALVIGVQLVAGIILIIIFSVRKKKRRKKGA